MQLTILDLKYLQVPNVRVNCIECYSTRLIYEQILDGLSNTVPSPSNMYTHYAKCDNMNDFVRLLKALLDEDGVGSSGNTVCVVSSFHSYLILCIADTVCHKELCFALLCLEFCFATILNRYLKMQNGSDTWMQIYCQLSSGCRNWYA